MKLTTLQQLFVSELKDLYSAENQLVKALPKMAKAATTAELRKGFKMHFEQTREHAARLERICKELGESPKGKKCTAMEGLIEEGKGLMEVTTFWTFLREFSPQDAGARLSPTTRPVARLACA